MPFVNQWKGENDFRKYFMINLHERMLPTSAGIKPATSWSPVDAHPEPPRPAYEAEVVTDFKPQRIYTISGLFFMKIYIVGFD